MKKDFLTDEQVEIEIQRLWQSDEVRLAKKETNIKYRRRQQLYMLRYMEKRGKELMRQGYTMENIEQRMFGNEIENE